MKKDVVEYFHKSCDEDGTVKKLTESRRTVRADAKEIGRSSSRVGLVKAKASNETRALPLQSRTLLEVLSDFPFRGIIRVVPRIQIRP